MSYVGVEHWSCQKQAFTHPVGNCSPPLNPHTFNCHFCSFHRIVFRSYCFLCTWYACHLVLQNFQIRLNMQCYNCNLAKFWTNYLYRTEAFYFYFSALVRTQWVTNEMGIRIPGFLLQIYHKIIVSLGNHNYTWPLSFFFFYFDRAVLDDPK